MRVALNIEQLLQRPPGGIGRYAAEIARLLPLSAPGDVDVTPFVARHARRDVDAAFASFGLTADAVVLPVPRRVLYELWNAYGIAGPTQLARSLRDVDVVHATSMAVPPRAGVPLVVTVHDAASVLFPDAFSRNGRRFHRQGFAATAARADAVIAPTGAAADEIAAHTSIARDRITVIHHGVDHDIASDRSVATERENLALGDDPYVLWVGTFEPRKNVPVVIDAFAKPSRPVSHTASCSWGHATGSTPTSTSARPAERIRIAHRDRWAGGRRSPRGAVPRRRLVRAAERPRGLRPSRARGDGAGDGCVVLRPAGVARGRRRRGAVRRAA